MKASEYIYIEAWHTVSGSLPGYISRVQQDAEEDNAPERAIYLRSDKTWATIDDVRNEGIKRAVEAYVKRFL